MNTIQKETLKTPLSIFLHYFFLEKVSAFLLRLTSGSGQQFNMPTLSQYGKIFFLLSINVIYVQSSRTDMQTNLSLYRP